MDVFEENGPMNLDPAITVANLLAAIPSSALVLMRLGMTGGGDANKTLQQACADRGIEFEQLLRAMNAIDWSGEVPATRESDQP
jgi:hypothetical protein